MFQGCGVARTDWEHVVTGLGYTEYEAIEDAFEMLAQDGWDTSDLRNPGDDRETVDDRLKEEMGRDLYEEEYGDEMMGGPQPHFYVCVYVK